MHHLLDMIQQARKVDPHDCRGNHAEVGERRIPTPNAGEPQEDASEAVTLSDLLHLRARVGDGDEAAARLIGPHRLLNLEGGTVVDYTPAELMPGGKEDNESRLEITAAVETATTAIEGDSAESLWRHINAGEVFRPRRGEGQ